MTGITLHAGLADRLIAASGDRIFGMKDSSNDARLQAEVIARRPGVSIFPGSESDLAEAKRRGAAGCISGSVALWPQLAKTVFENGDDAQTAELRRLRASLDGLPLVAAVRYLTALSHGDPDWERAMPPQQPLSAEQRRELGVISASTP
jgi:4-hydroxy-tetrahydrodipicolinate synthase